MSDPPCPAPAEQLGRTGRRLSHDICLSHLSAKLSAEKSGWEERSQGKTPRRNYLLKILHAEPFVEEAPTKAQYSPMKCI